MPTSGNRGNVARRSAYRLRGKSARSVDTSDVGAAGDCGDLLQIGPALGGARAHSRVGLGPRAHSTLGRRETNNALTQEHRVEKERCDRISLDRRGLTSLPSSLCNIDPLYSPRLLSLQHNLLTSLAGLSSPCLHSLVLLDLYDNQLQDVQHLDQLKNLRVLLIGKNRIRKIDGLSGVAGKLEVLDLHGNRICLATGLSGLKELKVLNLAGNQLKSADLTGLPQLRELNLKRNKLRRVMGCDGAPKLQKLFLSNNDLQSIEDISSVATVSSLREITLDGNPVALGGDCIPYLVSHLPTLNFLSQMQVTEQVRRAAMSWRQNKEASDNSVYRDLGDEADARREQVISNARTNWELLRAQNKCFISPTTSFTNGTNQTDYLIDSSNVTVPKSETPDLIKTTSTVQFVKPQTAVACQGTKQNNTQNQKYIPVSNGLTEKRVNFSYRSMSQDTDVSHSTSTSSELLKLPPILVPIIDSLEHQRLTLGGLDTSNKTETRVLKRWESISSVDPVINSSLSSLPTTTSESESEVTKKPTQRRVQTAQKKRASFAASKSVSISEPPVQHKLNFKNRSVSDNSENVSVVSNGTNLNSVLTNSSTSGSDMAASKKVLVRTNSAKSRYTKSATTRRSAMKTPQNRPVTAKAKSTKVVEHAETPKKEPPAEPVVKDREQGGDWLVEVRGVEASVWGAGALRRLEKGWPQALQVSTVHFHYINFGAICAVLPTIKNRFPNAVHLSFRACGLSVCGQLGALAALRGLHSLSIHKEGNPITSRSCWHQFALYRLAHWGLRTIDEKEMTDDDISAANDIYAGLSDVVLWSLPDSLLQPLLVRLQGEREGNKYNNVGEKDGITSNQNTERDSSNTRRRPLEREGSIQRRPLEREGSIQKRPLEREGSIQRRPLEREGSFHQRGRVLERENSVQQRKDGNTGNAVTRRGNENNDEAASSSPVVNTARTWLWSADPALRDVVAREALQWRRSVMSQEEVLLRHRGRSHLSRLLLHAVDASLKLRMLRRHWPAILLLLLTRFLHDFADMQQHVDEHMKQLNTQLMEEGMNKK